MFRFSSNRCGVSQSTPFIQRLYWHSFFSPIDVRSHKPSPFRAQCLLSNQCEISQATPYQGPVSSLAHRSMSTLFGAQRPYWYNVHPPSGPSERGTSVKPPPIKAQCPRWHIAQCPFPLGLSIIIGTPLDIHHLWGSASLLSTVSTPLRGHWREERVSSLPLSRPSVLAGTSLSVHSLWGSTSSLAHLPMSTLFEAQCPYWHSVHHPLWDHWREERVPASWTRRRGVDCEISHRLDRGMSANEDTGS